MGLVHTPRVLFRDEPTLGLDAQSRALIWRYIEKLNRDFKMTIFLTTHYLEEADQLCDRIAIIDGGKIKIQGSPEELKRNLGGEIVQLELAEVDNPKLKTLLQAIPGVIRVSIEASSCSVEVLDAESSIPLLVVELTKNGFVVRRVSTRVANLNQVFLRYIGRKEDAADDEDDVYKTILRERLLSERT